MKILPGSLKHQKGQILPLLLIAMVVGALLIVPSLQYVGTHVRTGQVLKENVEGLYAADAGIEDALCRIQANWADWSTTPSWQLDYVLPGNPNQMTVEVTANVTDTILGNKIVSKGTNPPDQHTEWLSINTAVSSTPSTDPDHLGQYLYTFVSTLTNLHTSTTHIDVVWFGIQAGTFFIDGSTQYTGDCAAGFPSDPDTKTGGGGNPLLLIWGDTDNPKQLFTLGASASEIFTFQVWGPTPDAELPSGITFYDAVMPNDTDKGAAIGNNQYAYLLLTSTATNQNGQQATITSHVMIVNKIDSGNITGVAKMKILDWQVTP
ncbi:MAG: hypothetical protein Q7R50_05835 [Dehalococcoidales bacterium]|nr:hypothetical protein [Dehalococcoidales bacterium]